MDSSRFDAVARSLAAGTSRRNMLRALLGLGGGMLAAGTFGPVEAARRPRPTPNAPACPGEQVWDGSSCVCTSGEQCGPTCCPEEAQCCDNACCYGVCYGEELCCESPREWCAVTGVCCPSGSTCRECGCVSNGGCCSDADCRDLERSCFAGACGEDGMCGARFDCRAGGDSSCCEAGTICQLDGSCTQASIAPYFVRQTYDNGDVYCKIYAVFSGFRPSTTYVTDLVQLVGGTEVSTLRWPVVTDADGGADQHLGYEGLIGTGSIFVRIDSVDSAVIPILC